MKRTSSRTLILLVELLVAVVVYQFLAWTPSAGAATAWLSDDPNEVVDPNASEEGEPLPEVAIGVLGVRNL